MRTLNEYYADFINAADFGNIRHSSENEYHSAIIDIDGRWFLLAINRNDVLGLTLSICEGGEIVTFSQSDLSEDEEYMLGFIYNFLAA